ncbi:MAG TPA: pyrroline-5-carboxylate reductase [Alphaproteobacteria bacterium]|nr:pyrroline-5-carboxylate reductase [Alphaproteobacteria bacterium]
MKARILLVGGGKMGGSMLAGWLARGLPRDDALVVEPGLAAAALAKLHRVGVLATPDAIDPGFRPEVVAFAVKPQMVDTVAPAYARFAGSALFMSIAAGKSIATYRKHLGPRAAIVRVMPNTPAAIGRGMSVCCAGGGVSDAQRQLCGELMAAVGEVAWVEDEALLDPVTAVSGSGPAYVFLLAEALAAAGVKAGLEPELAMRLARATVAGSGELLARAEESAAQLRQNVTSPAGTTQAALEILMGPGGFQDLLDRAVEAATRRARDLAS